jgi:hypothetical protein
MLVVLQATSGSARPQRFQLRAHQAAKVGRSEWADFSFGGDMTMADVQFEIRSTADTCTVRSLSQDVPTRVNGAEVQLIAVNDGDQIEAGQTTFLVRIEGQKTRPRPSSTMAPESVLAPPPAESVVATAMSLVATCAYLEFADDVGAMALAAKTPDELITKLAEQERFQDALRLRAHLLSKRQAIWWGCLCCREELGAPMPARQSEAVDAAANWVKKPDDKRRRVAEERAAAAKYSGFGASLALGAFWSSDSIAPEGNPDVLPDERLTSQGVAAALISAAYHGDAIKAVDRLNSFLTKGKALADGEIALPELEEDDENAAGPS